MASVLTLFSKSPFEPLYKHRDKARECVDFLKPLFEAVFSGDDEAQVRITDAISKSEREADLLKVEIRRILPKGIFLPVNREDLLRYLKIQDNIADTVEDITVLLSMKELSAPVGLVEQTMDFIDCVLDVCDLADNATNHLKPLVAAGFKGDDVSYVINLAEQTELAERKADVKSLELARTLFKFEDEMKATDIFIWFKIFDLIGKIADHAEKTGEWLRNMVTR